MMDGKTFTDSQGHSWTVERSLGKGDWCSTWSVRGPEGKAILKLPLGPEDFPNSGHPVQMSKASREVFDAQLNALAKQTLPFLPPLVGFFENPADGSKGFLVPRYETSLESLLNKGLPLSETIDIVVRILHHLAHKAVREVVHGNLHPRNILLNAEEQIVLTDPYLPEVAQQQHRLRLASDRRKYLPPEAGQHPSGIWDTWSLCCIMFRAAMSPTSADDPKLGKVVALPEQGISRVQLAAVKDAAAARLRAESTNRRFASRATTEFGRILNRGLSAQAEPSPPYRFARAVDLLPRLINVDELIHPAVRNVSKVLMAHHARNGVFQSGEDIVFYVTVGTTSGVTAHEDLTCGVKVVPLDSPDQERLRISGSRFTVKRYPSGRWRFTFELPEIPPGRYQVGVAFAIRDSDETPRIAEGTLQVRAKPGYVPPPPEEPQPEAIAFPTPPPPSQSEAAPAVAVVEFDESDEEEDEPPTDPQVAQAPILEPLVREEPSPTPPPVAFAPVSAPSDPGLPLPVSPPPKTSQPPSYPGPVSVPGVPTSSPQTMPSHDLPKPQQVSALPSMSPPPAYRPPSLGAGTAAAQEALPNNEVTLPSPNAEMPMEIPSFDEPMLDYPSPGDEFSDLPDYASGPHRSTPQWQVALEPVMDFIRREPFMALIGFVGVLIALIMVFSLF